MHFIKFIEIIRSTSTDKIPAAMEQNGFLTSSLLYYILWRDLSASAGLLIGFFISLFIVIRRRWFWLNSLITFILFIILTRFGPPVWQYSNQILSYPGKLFNNTVAEFLVTGLLLLGIGLFLFFSRHTTRFVDSKYKV
ncbi:MAG: hypothetical protein JST86_19410 [Bacteroidetes bacterium]|nr:hypothetical protein [Bacteroidota bacterium]